MGLNIAAQKNMHNAVNDARATVTSLEGLDFFVQFDVLMARRSTYEATLCCLSVEKICPRKLLTDQFSYS